MVIAAMPLALTRICIITEPELMISAKWPMKDRNTPTQNTASDCSPHLISGIEHRPSQSGPVLRDESRDDEHGGREMQHAERREIDLVVRNEGVDQPAGNMAAELREASRQRHDQRKHQIGDREIEPDRRAQHR